MRVLPLKDICRLTLTQCIVREDSSCVSTDLQWLYLIRLLDHGSWGEQSKEILDRVVEYYGDKVTSRIVEALLPCSAKEVVLKECPRLTGECLNMVISRCRHLQVLDLTENPELAFDDIQLFQPDSGVFHDQLTTLVLEDCPQVMDEDIQAVLRNAPSLHTLNIARCSITDQVFLINETKQLAREACLQLPRLKDGYDSKLQSVDVSRCKHFSSTGVRHLCTLCGPSLTSVNLSWTKVDCTALLYLSGYGLPAAVQFYLSLNFLGKPMVEALLFMLQNFERISQQISEQWFCKEAAETSQRMAENLAYPCTGISNINGTEKNDMSFTANPLDGSSTAETEHLKSAEVSAPLSLNSTVTVDSKQSSSLANSESAIQTFNTGEVTCQNKLPPFQISDITEHRKILIASAGGNTRQEHRVCSSVVNGDASKTVSHTAVDSIDSAVVDGEGKQCPGLRDTDNHVIKKFVHVKSESQGNVPNEEQLSEAHVVKPHSHAQIGASVVENDGSGVDCGMDSQHENMTDIEISSQVSSWKTGTSDHCNYTSIPEDNQGDIMKKKVPVASLDNNIYQLQSGLEGSSVDGPEYSVGLDSETLLLTSENSATTDMDTDLNRVCDACAEIRLESGNVVLVMNDSSNAAEVCSEASSSMTGSAPDGAWCTEQTDDLSSRRSVGGRHEPAVSLDDGEQDPSLMSFTSVDHRARKQPFFTSNITNLCINGTIFEDELMGMECFKKFLVTNSNLSVLKLFGGLTGNFVSDNVLEVVGKHGGQLICCSIEGCDHVTSIGATHLAKCKQLTDIDLTGVAFVDDSGILMLVYAHPFSRLLLAETQITSIALNSIATRPVASQLKELDLSWCEDMDDDDGLNNVVDTCRSLERLMLRECIGMTSTTLKLLADGCHLITELSVASNMNVVHDDEVIMLSENMPLLEKIDLGWNTHLTDKSICALMTNCPQLKVANLEGLKQITSAPFVGIVAVPDQLQKYLERLVSECSEDHPVYDLFVKVSELPCLPQRSTVYCTELRLLHLKYSDYVEDDRLQEIVAITQGSVKVIDYYGEQVEEMPHTVERYINRLI